MSRKPARKKQAPSRQQQQEAAARRRAPAPAAVTRRAQESGEAGSRTGTATVTGQETAASSGEVRHYLDVSAVRIQEWLARTPDLRLRRGASVLLSEATGRDAWPDKSLPPGMNWNDQAGDLDGVVSLVVADTVAEADIGGCLAAAAREIAAELRRAMPQCPVQAVTGKGDSYAAAYQEIDRARRDGDLLVDAPPAPAEVILAKPCDDCRSAPATRGGIEIAGRDSPAGLCEDCLARSEAAGGTKGDRPRRSPGPERRMRAALAQAHTTVTGFPDDFRQLAQAGARDGDDAATQLGLVYADGNRVGAFLSEAAACARTHGTPAKAEIVPALDDSTLAALADAIMACLPRSGRPPVLAHLAGGDDLMVSVPAGYAWPFVRELLRAFGNRIGAKAAGWPEPVRERLPSLSAGLVFHHQSAPFSDVVRLAKEQLDAAKRATRGCAPSVAFLDLTADGGHSPAGRAPWTLEHLDGGAGRLDEIALIPRSHRETLVALHRLSTENTGAAERDNAAESPAQALARRVIDLGYPPLWEAVAGAGATPDAVRTALDSGPGSRDELRRILDLARWWPPGEPAGERIPA